MADVDIRELARYRMQSARERLAAARVLLENGLFRDATSRAYYAVFQAARAVAAAPRSARLPRNSLTLTTTACLTVS